MYSRSALSSEYILPAGSAGSSMLRCSLPWASSQIRKIAGCACAGNAGNVFPCRRFQIKPLVSDPGMHHGTCVTHVPWCMSGSLTCGDRENVPGIPGACAPAILRIWQEAHAGGESGASSVITERALLFIETTIALSLLMSSVLNIAQWLQFRLAISHLL